ncbi:Phospholipase/Carboxylesterase [Blattabacterium sp. (Nauphoeta cinerea)]|uniref:alpha/beta hydrolase n=1 Tax=Blattabacterium sp. (Nauphoeta cinerea) TaxID=1316444 RepID=UPI0003B0C474|nr:phospholipase/carboxylesterase [Blattabacterium sp. (Nauphoeta cinerea)]AGW86339.1 Phospholipase/Carboxylesterase [Blattabacterium sp. (Nauphoeta cinerea)]
MLLKNKLSIKHIIKKPVSGKESTLFLMIHGYGSNEKDLFSFKKDLPEDFFIISIQGFYSIETGKYSWYDIDFDNEKKFINITQAKKTIDKISFFIHEAIKEYKLKKNPVWICGFSQGAILSYAIALKNSDKIKKVIALSGYLENSLFPKKINHYTDLEFFISHGKYDTIIPVDWVKKGLKFLKQKKVLSLFYKEYESGHTLNDTNYQDLINWIKEKHIYSEK